MGSAASTIAPRTASRNLPKPVKNVVSETINRIPNGAQHETIKSAADGNVTARVRTTSPTPHRMTTPEWADLLKNISGSISSSTWEGTKRQDVHHVKRGEMHSAQRSPEYVEKLPAKPEHSRDRLENEEQKAAGTLSQNQILALFNLRRRDHITWTPSKIADRFGVPEDDVRNLLHFTRTYTARVDGDGHMRGYFKANTEDTIVRFERD